MKKLVKIRLINWYTFHDETIEIKGNTLISGQNGCGKSTLLDAIQYVLTGGSTKFNKAADENSKRTLESYVRCKINTESKNYLRNGDVTSYIALEFQDDKQKRTDIIGAVIEIPLASRLNRTFFHIKEKTLEDDLFLIGDILKTTSQFKHNQGIETFDSKHEIKRMIKSVLGINSDKYFELINKALAFKPILNLNDFVNDFLLTENKLDLENLNNNINNFKELENIIQREEEKIKELEKIEKLYEDYQSKNNQVQKLSWFLHKLELKRIESEINNLKKEYTKLENEKSKNIYDIEKIDKKRNLLSLDLNELGKSQINNKNYNLYQTLSQDIEELKEQLAIVKIKYDTFFKTLKSELSVANLLKVNKIKDITKTNHENALFNLNSHQKLIEDAKENIKNEQREYENRKNDIISKSKVVSLNLERLNKQKLPYKESVIFLQEAIKEELSLKYNQNIEVRPLCEYLEITDDAWRDAIEGYLNTQRFDLIVEPKYFDDAITLYEKIKKEKHIHGVGLVNTGKLKDEEIEEGTLATLIKANNLYARLYAITILNHVKCCDNVLELKKYQKAITKTCMVYRNNVARQINPNVYEDKYIGEIAKKELFLKNQKKYNEYQALLKEIASALSDNQRKLDILYSSKIIDLLNNVSVLNQYINITSSLAEKEKLILEIKNSGILFDLLAKIEELKEKLAIKNKELEEKKNVNNLLFVKLEELTKNIAVKEEEREAEIQTIPEIPLTLKDEWEEELLTISKNTIIIEKRETETKIIRLITLLEEGMKNFNEIYSFDEVPEINNIKKYIEYLYKMREIELAKYKSNSIEFKERCQKSFREDFIGNLRDLIYEAQSEIKELNKALKNNPFGTEKYEFVYGKSEDSELAKYYDIIMSGANFTLNNLFDETLTNEQLDAMDALFQKLTSGDSSLDSVVNEYTDYRKYMSYDIKITNNEGDVYYFSKVSKEKSGGEIQTPFYVIIAASFEQLLKTRIRDNSVGVIVMFDEAFNTMDESRIEAMMNFYNQLNIQLLIAVPPEKIAIIAPNVETNLILKKEKNITGIINIRKSELVI